MLKGNWNPFSDTLNIFAKTWVFEVLMYDASIVTVATS
jgi:hypothetical protein